MNRPSPTPERPPPPRPAPQVVWLAAAAPAKPAVGAPCNGCGLCCAWQPCPLGVLVSGRLRGACAALRWQADQNVYRCAMVCAPGTIWPWLPAALQRWVQRLAGRWIAAGQGCDCDAEPQAPEPGAAA